MILYRMVNRWTTLTEFILKEEQAIPGATGRLTLLLNQIAEGSKIIASHVKKSGLIDIIGKTGVTNSYDEEVQKLDEFANNLLIDILSGSGQVAMIGSEELDRILEVKDTKGEYTVFMDPLDGSSNIDTNASTGTIFSIYHKKDGDLPQGAKQVAAGYVTYGSSVMMVYTCGQHVNGFTLDPAIGSFLLSHPNMQIPKTKKEYSINEGYSEALDEPLKKYLAEIKKSKNYKLRYIGSMVADVHRILIKGGIFFHPKDIKNPSGKLRLMVEVNPMSLLVSRAGGKAYANGVDPLTISPEDLGQRVPIVLGSEDEVEKYMQYERKNG